MCLCSFIVYFSLSVKPLISLQPIAKLYRASFVPPLHSAQSILPAPSFTFRYSAVLLVHIRPPLISHSPAACTCSALLHHPKAYTERRLIVLEIFSSHQHNCDGAERSTQECKRLTLELSLVNILHHYLLTLQYNKRQMKRLCVCMHVYVYMSGYHIFQTVHT